MKRSDLKLLLDENISTITLEFLSRLNFDIKRIVPEDKLENSDIIDKAANENRVLITFDLDFGEITALASKGESGVIVLRLADQRPENASKVLASFFSKFTEQKLLKGKLFIVTEKKVRTRQIQKRE